MIPVVELLRVSSQTQAQEDRAGLAAQHTANLRTCDTYGLEIIETVELVVSGTDVADTPEMQRVRDLVESGRARGIVIAEYSRLSRSDRFSDQRVLQTFADHGAPIDRTERAQRLADVDRQLRALKAVGARHASTAPAPDTIQTIERIVTVFAQWQHQERADKLAILDALHAQLHIGKYAVRGITLPVASLQNSHVPTAARVGIGAIRSLPTIFLPFAGAA